MGQTRRSLSTKRAEQVRTDGLPVRVERLHRVVNSTNRGNTYFALGQYRLATADYTRALKLDPQLIQVYNNRGAAYEAEGEVNKAIADFERFLSLTDNPQWRTVVEQHLRQLKGTQTCYKTMPSCVAA